MKKRREKDIDRQGCREKEEGLKEAEKEEVYLRRREERENAIGKDVCGRGGRWG